MGTGIVPFVDIDFRVVLGISDFITEEKFTKTTDWDTANLQFMLGVTYWF